MTRATWREYAVVLAEAAATRSEDPYLKCGAAVLREDGTVASLGYNGAPPGVEIDWADRDERRLRVIHAEANALRYVTPGEGALMATTHLPCLDCMKLIRGQGITVVAYRNNLPETFDTPQILKIAEEFGMRIVKVPR